MNLDQAIGALDSGDLTVLKKLASADRTFPKGSEPQGEAWIMHGIYYAPASVVEWMLQQGADVNAQSRGYSTVHAVFERDNPERRSILDVLIRYGADLNVRGPNGWTPAHMAAREDDLECLQMLVNAGADLSLRTIVDWDLTPLEEAIQAKSDQNIINYLKARTPDSGNPN